MDQYGIRVTSGGPKWQFGGRIQTCVSTRDGQARIGAPGWCRPFDSFDGSNPTPAEAAARTRGRTRPVQTWTRKPYLQLLGEA